jgi:hypothetical protein
MPLGYRPENKPTTPSSPLLGCEQPVSRFTSSFVFVKRGAEVTFRGIKVTSER